MSLEAILFLAFGFLGANLLDSNFISPYLGHGGGTLQFHLLALVGWITFFGVGKSRTLGERRQFWWTLIFVMVFVGMAMMRQLSWRGAAGEPIGIHDGAVQVEVAAEKVFHGENPYQADYRGTRYEILNPVIPGGPTVNVVWSHFIYPPAVFLFQAVWHLIGSALQIFPDVRWVFLLGLVAVSWIAVSSQRTWTMRTRLLLLTAGNPLLWLYVVTGYNDILSVAALGGTAWAFLKKQWTLAGVLFALALGLKQSTWLLLPLVAWYIWRLWQHQPMAGRSWVRGLVIMSVVIWLPFILWDAGALYDDIARYASGSIAYSYPISGATALQYLHIWGLIDSPWTVIPAYWFQLAVWIPLTVWLCRYLGRQPQPGQLVSASAILITAVLLVSRYNNNNYLSAVIGLAVLAYAFHHDRDPA